MINPGWIAQSGSGPYFIGRDKAEVEHLSGGRAYPCRNIDSYPVLLRAGEDVVLLQDNDEAGADFDLWVARELAAVAKSVKVLVLPDLPPKGDVSDWFLAGGTVEELERLADECPKWAAPAETAPRQGPLAFETSDAGNAELYAHLYGDRVRYDHQRGRWLTWDEHRWGPDRDGQLWRWAIEAARERKRAAADLDRQESDRVWAFARSSESTAKVKAMMEQLRALPPVADPGAGWDANPLLLGCVNGVVNLANGEVRPGRKEDRVTLSSGIALDPAASCPRWLQFLEEVFVARDVIAFIQRAAGYSLTGSTREQVWFLCYGDGANGKSTFLETILALLGGLVADSYGADTAADTLVKRGQTSSIPADLAALVNKRFVICSESDNVSSLHTGRIKSLTGGDPQTAWFMRENFFTFVPVLKLWLATNHLPRVSDPTDGFWRRVRLIPFLAKFEGPTRDPDLRDKLRAELPGILNWAIEGALAWHREGLRPPQSVLLATLQYRWDSDPLGEFKTECCITEPLAKAGSTQLYRAYVVWAEHQGITEKGRLGRDTFLRMLVDEGYKMAKTDGVRVIRGIRLRTENEPIQQNGLKMTLFSDSQGHLEAPIPVGSEVTSSYAREPENGSQDDPDDPVAVLAPDPGADGCMCADCPAGENDCSGQPWRVGKDQGWHCNLHCPAETDDNKEE